MWLARLNVNLLKIDKIRNAVPQPHWSHFKCAIASCGWRQPYWTTKIQNFASLQKGLLYSSAQNDGWKQTYEGTLPWSFRTPGTKRRSQNACRESEGIKIRFAYKESEIRRALIFSTVILETSLVLQVHRENSSPPRSLCSNQASSKRVEQRYIQTHSFLRKINSSVSLSWKLQGDGLCENEGENQERDGWSKVPLALLYPL